MPTTGFKPAQRLNDAPPPTKSDRFGDFWERITEGLELDQLWSSFKEEAKSGYRLYSKEVPERDGNTVSRRRRARDVASGFFWAILNKFSPAKRVILLASVIFILMPSFSIQTDNGKSFNGDAFHTWGGIGILVLLLMEVADRITMKRDLEIAREIQTWLLPEKAPDIPGLDVAFFNRPANTVAGDYYDVFGREAGSGGAGKFVITVADVAGKSMPAALLMATFQASLKTQSSSSCDLLNLVSCVNQYACAHSRNGTRFTTAVIAEYDPATRSLEYVNAGHNSPMLLKKSGELVRLEVGGLPLGIMRDAQYSSARLTLSPGDLLLIFTDGLSEAVNEKDEEYQDDRISAQLRVAGAQSATAAMNLLTADMQSFIGMARQHDDITCLMARCTD
jgi:phosphoserine phosphatase RsbU/P